jgi:AcrR family transcriptional regulator
MEKAGPYHHGNLAQAVLTAAVAAITESGPERLSMRDLARRAGVSHAAPRHHFGDKAGLLTAVATEGFALLADALEAEQHRTGDFVEVGVAYVRFAVDHRAYFELMFRPELYRRDDPGVQAASERAAEALYRGAGSVLDGRDDLDPRLGGVAAWSLVHGFATLWLDQALPTWLGEDLQAAARAVASLLVPPQDLTPSAAG